MIDRMTSYFSRLFFAVALILFIIAIIDWILGVFGWRFTWIPYQPGRLLEFAAILVIFVIALLLRQIREGIRSGKQA